MTKDEALKLALKAFEWNYNTDLDNIPACEKWAKMLKENIAAIKEALAQPPQRTWVGLTDEEISELIRATHNTGSFVRAIEAKLKAKNT